MTEKEFEKMIREHRGTIYTVCYMFSTDKDFTARFYYSLDGMDFHPIGNVLKMGLGLPWTANRFCLFNFTTKENGTDGYADFNWFRFTNK